MFHAMRSRLISTSLAALVAAILAAPAIGGAQEEEKSTVVDPVISNAPRYIPPVGQAFEELRGCGSRLDLLSLNQGIAVDDQTELNIRAEVNYRSAAQALEKATPADRSAAQARFNEAERYLADVQDAMRLPQGAPIRQIVEAKATERNRSDGVDGIYTPDEYRDLRISRVEASRRTVRGQAVLHVTGRIHNPRLRSIAIPPLWFAALDARGETLKTQQSVAQKPVRIAARGSVPFTFDLVAPAGAERAAVTFAPRNRLPRVQPYEQNCPDGGAVFRGF
jgi:hypothetical protein